MKQGGIVAQRNAGAVMALQRTIELLSHPPQTFGLDLRARATSLVAQVALQLAPLLTNVEEKHQLLVVRLAAAAALSLAVEGPGPVRRWARRAWTMDQRRF